MNCTPGEWKTDNAYGVSTENGGLIVEAKQSDHTIVVAMINAHKEARANAQLIAAAPDMYEALKAAQARLEQYHDVTEMYRLERQMQVALAKAETL